MTIVLYFRRLRVPFGLRDFLRCRLKRGLSSGANKVVSNSSIKGRVSASTIAFFSGSQRRLLLFLRTVLSISSKFNVRADLKELADTTLTPDDERESDALLLTPDDERESDALLAPDEKRERFDCNAGVSSSGS